MIALNCQLSNQGEWLLRQKSFKFVQLGIFVNNLLLKKLQFVFVFIFENSYLLIKIFGEYLFSQTKLVLIVLYNLWLHSTFFQQFERLISVGCLVQFKIHLELVSRILNLFFVCLLLFFKLLLGLYNIILLCSHLILKFNNFVA